MMMKNSKVVPIVTREVQELERVVTNSRECAIEECRELLNLIFWNRPREKGEPHAAAGFTDELQGDLLLDRLVHLMWNAHRRGFLDALEFESDRWARGLCGNDYKKQFRKAGVKL